MMQCANSKRGKGRRNSRMQCANERGKSEDMHMGRIIKLLERGWQRRRWTNEKQGHVGILV
jgi:hypothetical protein